MNKDLPEHVIKVTVEDYGGKEQKYMSVCTLWISPDDAHLEYKLGVVTKPKIKNSCIYAFESVVNAVSFTLANDCREFCRLFVCEYEPFTDFWQQDHLPMIVAAEYVLDYWETGFGPAAHAPSGTVACQWVKPINVVSIDEIMAAISELW